MAARSAGRGSLTLREGAHGGSFMSGKRGAGWSLQVVVTRVAHHLTTLKLLSTCPSHTAPLTCPGAPAERRPCPAAHPSQPAAPGSEGRSQQINHVKRTMPQGKHSGQKQAVTRMPAGSMKHPTSYLQVAALALARPALPAAEAGRLPPQPRQVQRAVPPRPGPLPPGPPFPSLQLAPPPPLAP